MSGFLADSYVWLKALHIISVIAWMAGLLYLPRLFVYHTRVSPGSEADGLFQTMEAKLLRAIMNPAMIAAWLFGLLMLWANPALFSLPWMHAKLLLVVAMTGYHMAAAGWRKGFVTGGNRRGERFFRMVNEIPAVLMVAIVILAVAEPF